MGLLFSLMIIFFGGFTMEIEILGIILGAVLPVYPLLLVIYQKIGTYDEIVEEFKKLRAEHEQLTRVNYAG